MFFYKFLFFLMDLLKIQRESFYAFLQRGLVDELKKQKPVFGEESSWRIVLYFQHYKLIKPLHTISTCLLTGQSYTSQLFIPVQLTNCY